jgi:hypothetical protein
MRWAFVLQLGRETQVSQRKFEGWIEEVDTARKLRFRSTDELLTFLSQSFESAQQRALEPHEDDDSEDLGATTDSD